MKYIHLYEAWSKNIHIGDIYVIEEIIIAKEKYETNIELGRIVDIELHERSNLPAYFTVKTFIKNTNKEYFIEGLNLSYIKRKANSEEIIEFEMIENSNKYNL